MTTDKTDIDHLVLCVHGIGNQVAGETVDDVLSGAVAEHYRKAGTPVIADDTIVNLFEPGYMEFEGKSIDQTQSYPGQGSEPKVKTPIHTRMSKTDPKRLGMAKTFPVHLKRIRRQGAPASDVKTVMAEVYWADLSKQPTGALATIFDLLKVVMSVGYLALDNAANTRSRWGYRCVDWFLRVLIGGVVALNAALLMGVFVLLLEGWVFSFQTDPTVGLILQALQPYVEPVLACLAAAAILLGIYCGWARAEQVWWTVFGASLGLTIIAGLAGLFILPAAEAVFSATAGLTVLLGSYFGITRWDLSLWRTFGIGTVACGLLVLLSIPFVPETHPDALFSSETIEEACGQTSPCEFVQLGFFIGWVMLLLEVAWLFAVALCLIVYGAWLNDSGKLDDSGPDTQRRMFAPICSALLLLWMVVASSAWVSIQHALENAPEWLAKDQVAVLPQALDHAIEPLVPNMALGVGFLMVLVLVAVFVVIMRALNKDVLFKTAVSAPWIGRLLLNGLFQVVFAASTVVFAVLAADLLFIKAFGRQSFGAVDFFERDFLRAVLPYVPIILLGLALLVYQFRGLVAGGLGAFRDIVVYANNDALDPSMDDGKDLSNFPPRAEIEGRFQRVCEFLMGQVNPQRVTVISHSQGTVVATRNLRRLLAAGVFKGCDVTLVTMGSPVTHLYRKYFPEAFRVEAGDFQNAGTPITWFNIGRTDDFVGTYIENLDAINGLAAAPGHVPSERNLLVPAGGHPGYFTDPYVWQHLSDKIKFRLL
ncbi:MAG: hypothetical protein AAF280_07590 [Pseudomonadota bacterium]